jgi:Family of unknown function (DUF5694)
MIRSLAVSLIALVAFAPSALASPPAEPPIQVMVLGVYHFDNPGRDIHNAKVDDVTTPRRQAELADVATRLAGFKPTRIALEAQVDAPDLTYAKYRAFKPADLSKNRDERVQLGFRVAQRAGLADVYGIDADGDFPYDKVQAFAERTSAGKARFAALDQQVGDTVRELNALQKTQSVAALLARFNEPAQIRTMHAFYNALLAFGDTASQPGAELDAAWYLRNARIFARLTQIAKPGDRVIVVFGAGHAYWLRHFVETTPGFELVEPDRYLVDAKK